MNYYTIYEAGTDRLVGCGTVGEISKALGVNNCAVSSIICHCKAGRVKRYTVAIEDLETGAYTVYGENNKPKLRKMDKTAVARLYHMGLSDIEIADRLGRCAQSVRHTRKKLGPPNRYKRWHRRPSHE